MAGAAEESTIVKVFLADDHQILLDGIRHLLEEGGLNVVGKAASGREALEKLEKLDVDLLITDFSMPNMDGLALVNKARKLQPNLKVIVLSMHDEPHLVKEILKAGVDGYVLKKNSHTELKEAIRNIQQGKTYLSSQINELLISDLKYPDKGKLLTDREREILQLIVEEFTNKEIAQKLYISERTVETHRKNIFKKTDSNTVVGLIKYAYDNNLI